MEIVQHRINSLAALRHLPSACGAEIDIRSSQSQLVLSHDPFTVGDSLEEYLKLYAQKNASRLLVLNVKEDGLEKKITELMKIHQLKNYFFLDLSAPTLIRMAIAGQSQVAVRVSEYEPELAARTLAKKADWAWVDCFSGKAPELAMVKQLRQTFKVCLVSPELQGYDASTISAFLPLKAHLDAVCTKSPERWS